jgi:predicted CopG family antitoxin
MISGRKEGHMFKNTIHIDSTRMTKTITVTDEAYTALARLKKHPRDSFSKVIIRLASRKGNPLDVAGAWRDMGDDEARELLEQSRRDFESVGGRR